MKHDAIHMKGTGQRPEMSVAMLESLLGALDSFVFALDGQYRITYLSAAFDDITGIRGEDMLGLHVIDPQWGEAGVEVGLSDYHQTLMAQKPVLGLSYERVMHNGIRSVLMDSMWPQFDKNGAFQGYIGITLVVSRAFERADDTGSLVSVLSSRAQALEAELQERNRALAQSNKLLIEVLDAMGEGLMVTSGTELEDPDNVIVFVNPKYRALIGLTEDEVRQGMAVSELTEILARRGDGPDGGFEEIDEGMRINHDITWHLPSLDTFLLTRATPRPGGGYVIVHTDVTELQSRTEMLEAARRDADLANQAKTNFLAAMSHEIRTPMNGIVGMADLLSGGQLDAQQRESVETIRGAALALTSLISDILDFSKVEANKVEIEEKPFDLREMLREISSLLRPLAETKALELVLDVAPTVPGHVLGDSARLRQVLVNLMGNAIKFTLHGQVILRVHHEDRLTFDVCDTGIGIPPDKLSCIFNPFEQAQGGLQRQFEGTGLGLAISKRLVEAMGGEIAVRSTEGEGTTFSLMIPLKAANPESVAQGKAQTSNEITVSGARILVAEDNRTNQMVARRMLERLECDVTLVGDGRAAVEVASTHSFDVVLMDISMPKMSGLDATRMIRAGEARNMLPPVPIIALTGNAFDQDKQAAFAAGMDGFLSKPIQLVALQTALSEAIAKARSSKARPK